LIPFSWPKEHSLTVLHFPTTFNFSTTSLALVPANEMDEHQKCLDPNYQPRQETGQDNSRQISQALHAGQWPFPSSDGRNGRCDLLPAQSPLFDLSSVMPKLPSISSIIPSTPPLNFMPSKSDAPRHTEPQALQYAKPSTGGTYFPSPMPQYLPMVGEGVGLGQVNRDLIFQDFTFDSGISGLDSQTGQFFFGECEFDSSNLQLQGPRDWDAHRALIKKMYIDEDKSLREVMDIMEKNHGFKPSLVST